MSKTPKKRDPRRRSSLEESDLRTLNTLLSNPADADDIIVRKKLDDECCE